MDSNLEDDLVGSLKTSAWEQKKLLEALAAERERSDRFATRAARTEFQLRRLQGASWAAHAAVGALTNYIDKLTGSTAWTADFCPELEALERWEALVAILDDVERR